MKHPIAASLWADWEKDIVARLYPTGGYRACKEVLPHRSCGAIQNRASALGVAADFSKRPTRVRAHKDTPNSKPRNENEPNLVKRQCLKCREIFMSEGKHNHVCHSCKSSNAWRGGGMIKEFWV